MSVDGWNSSTGIGFNVVEANPRRAAPGRSWQVAQSALAAEHILLSDVPLFDLRPLVIQGFLANASVANQATDLDELKGRLKGGVNSAVRNVVDLEFSDRASKEYKARLVSVDVETVTPARTTADLVTINMVLLDPFLRDSSTSSVNGITTATAIPIGTAPSWSTMTINSPFTDPEIIYKTTGGATTLQTLSFTIDSATEGITDLIINHETGTITDNAAANRHSHRDSGSDFPWMLDPLAGETWNSTYGTLECDSGTLDVVTTKRWE
jgi:hypothetical protein